MIGELVGSILRIHMSGVWQLAEGESELSAVSRICCRLNGSRGIVCVCTVRCLDVLGFKSGILRGVW
jgi:hypothetical protein